MTESVRSWWRDERTGVFAIGADPSEPSANSPKGDQRGVRSDEEFFFAPLFPSSAFLFFKDPFTIMFSVPMGLIGVFGALYLTNTTLSTTSFMAIIITMVGIVVSNGVLLVESITP